MKALKSPTRISGIIVFLASSWMIWEALHFKHNTVGATDILGPAKWPLFLAGCMWILSLALIVFGDSKNKAAAQTESAAEAESETKQKVDPKALLCTVVAMIAYVFLFEVIGFLIATPLFLFGVTMMYGGKLKIAIIYSIVFTAILYLGFRVCLGILLPPIPFLNW